MATEIRSPFSIIKDKVFDIRDHEVRSSCAEADPQLPEPTAVERVTIEAAGFVAAIPGAVGGFVYGLWCGGVEVKKSGNVLAAVFDPFFGAAEGAIFTRGATSNFVAHKLGVHYLLKDGVPS